MVERPLFAIIACMQLTMISPVAMGQSDRSVTLELTPDEKEEIRSQQAHPWSRLVRWYRSAHNFAWMTGVSTTEWGIEGKTYRARGFPVRFQYDFHMEIARRVGWYLGTAFGYQIENQLDPRIEPPEVFHIPGLLMGLSINLSPALRVGGGWQFQLERWDGLLPPEGAQPREREAISLTSRALDFHAFMDTFLRLKWGLRLSVTRRWALFFRPDSSEGKPLNISALKQESVYAAGLVFHML